MPQWQDWEEETQNLLRDLSASIKHELEVLKKCVSGENRNFPKIIQPVYSHANQIGKP